MKDGSRWVFFQEGEPLPEEEVSRYRKLRVRDRVAAEYVLEVAARLGWQLTGPDTSVPPARCCIMLDETSGPRVEGYRSSQEARRQNGQA